MYPFECFILHSFVGSTRMVDLPGYAIYDYTLKRKCFTCQKFYEILDLYIYLGRIELQCNVSYKDCVEATFVEYRITL